jgi:hypothetical protein
MCVASQQNWQPTSEGVQTEKNSARANVFRATPESGHRSVQRHVSKVPQAASCSGAKGSLFDQFVGAADQRQRHCNAERLVGLEIDDQLDFRSQLNRQVGGLLALENFAGVNSTKARQQIH